ncbi:aminopeptidase P family protein [Microbulbifer sp. 2205BS26-8]|uniref:aminopeptidase P family protein n=1 Tax=Microbulbifer sp. 2205BS26-8 TaxID=3064386 RepID=UPI00273DBB05|nr:aminopeptidase P family protein [Microbulbifer sp. 2205BS26-8]MDP5209445.1 aminopeptidase P family protein [Microbulbifer sp. 2205BS26-8]
MNEERLEALREGLRQQGIEAFLVPRTDEYQNESIPPGEERLSWVTGFTGSAGMAVIGLKAAALFVDGRYTLQGQQQLGDRPIVLENLDSDGIANWICDQLHEGQTLGYDPRLHTEPGLALLQGRLEERVITLRPLEENPIDAIWTDRPEAPSGTARPHPFAFNGEHSRDKRRRIAAQLTEKCVDALWLPSPENCAWLFNIRGEDIPHLPVALANAVLYRDGSATLYLSAEAVGEGLLEHLDREVTVVSDKRLLLSDLRRRHIRKIWVDPQISNCWILQQLRALDIQLVQERDPVSGAKACKNAVELAGARAAHERDGAALCEFLAILSEAVDTGLDELSAVKLLYSKRAAREGFRGNSFDTISGYGPNGAIVHYRVSPESSLPMKPEGIYLCDSGAQYPDGTTDVTRTLALGDFPAPAREHFTRVLKGHIAIATLRFPQGTCGEQIDAIARRSLWEAGLDYAHGTGHGVGSYLSVHEGPQRIGKVATGVALQPGMILSNEPGFYLTGQYGIRIENLVYVKESGEYPGFLEFETLTLVPIDRVLIDTDLLATRERDWLNRYHQRVRQVITPLVDQHTANWLRAATEPL